MEDNSDRQRPTAVHTDAYSRDLGKPEDVSVAVTVSDGETDEDVTAMRTKPRVEFQHPVTDPGELEHTAHLTAQLATHNRDSHREDRHDRTE